MIITDNLLIECCISNKDIKWINKNFPEYKDANSIITKMLKTNKYNSASKLLAYTNFEIQHSIIFHDINLKSLENYTSLKDNLLLQAVFREDVRTVKFLLVNKINPNIHTKNKIYPLMLSKNLEISKLLIKYGANVNSKTKLGYTPLYFVIFNFENSCKGTKEYHLAHDLATLLVKNGAEIETISKKNMTSPLSYAKRTMSNGLFSLLIELSILMDNEKIESKYEMGDANGM